MTKFMPQSFNDFLCMALIAMIMTAWILVGLKVLELPSEVTGALIVTWTIQVQYYFRKKNGVTSA
jgi:hypothetical protein